MEIKFRAWEPSTKTMYYKSEQSIHTCFPFIDLQGKLFVFSGEMDEATEGNFILMQFSGIKDRSNTEVYKGDIVLDLTTKMKYVIAYGFCEKHGFTGWYAEYEDRQIAINNDAYCTSNSNIKVIGNIYQSPELINQ